MRRLVPSAIAAMFVATAVTGCASSSAGGEAVRPAQSAEQPPATTDDGPSASEPPGTNETPAAPAPIDGVSGVGDELFPDLGNPGIDVTHYDIDVTYDPNTSRLDAV